MATFGLVEQFNLTGKEKISEYLERLEEYYVANDIDNERKKKAILLTAIGQEAYTWMKVFRIYPEFRIFCKKISASGFPDIVILENFHLSSRGLY